MEFSTTVQTTISPHTQKPFVSRDYPSVQAVDEAIVKSKAAQKEWAKVPLKERIEIGRRFIVSVRDALYFITEADGNAYRKNSGRRQTRSRSS